MKTNFFFLCLGICCGLVCYKLYDQYFIDVPTEDCRLKTLTELQYDDTKNQPSESAQLNIQTIYNQLMSVNPYSNRSFTISKEFVAYMYFHYYNVLANFGKYYLSSNLLNSRCPHSCD